MYPGETKEASFDASARSLRHAIYSYQDKGFPRHSQGYMDVGDIGSGANGACGVRPTNGPNKASCTVSKGGAGVTVVFTVTIVVKPF